jgi:pilus assembly protein FimV
VPFWGDTAAAAGLGGIQVHSLLGQPLRAEIKIFSTKEESAGMVAALARPDAFAQTGLNYSSEHTRLRLTLEKRSDGNVIVVRSTEPIHEPYLDLLIEVSWPAGRLSRGYTVLLDPPEVATQSFYQPATVASVTSPAQVAEPAPMPASQETQVVDELPPLVDEPPLPVAPESPRVISTTGQGYVVKKGDNLHRVASTYLSPNVSLEQMLVAIHRANPEAFVGNNMHRLRQGALLRIPGAPEAGAMPHNEARQVVRAQTSSWNQYRSRIASAASGNVTAGGGGRSVSGTVSAQVEEKSSPAETERDKMLISRSNQSRGSAGVSEEDLIAQDKRLQESRDRVAALEKIVSDLQKLLDMKEQGLGELQKQLNSSPPGGEKPKTGRSGKPTAALDGGFFPDRSDQAGDGQIFLTIDTWVTA